MAPGTLEHPPQEALFCHKASEAQRCSGDLPGRGTAKWQSQASPQAPGPELVSPGCQTANPACMYVCDQCTVKNIICKPCPGRVLSNSLPELYLIFSRQIPQEPSTVPAAREQGSLRPAASTESSRSPRPRCLAHASP